MLALLAKKESRHLKRELLVAGKDVTSWTAKALSFESEGKANLSACAQMCRDRVTHTEL